MIVLLAESSRCLWRPHHDGKWNMLRSKEDTFIKFKETLALLHEILYQPLYRIVMDKSPPS